MFGVGRSAFGVRRSMLALFCCAALTTLSACTVAPAPIRPQVVAIGSTNKPDADVIDGNATGLLVRKPWVDSYFELETKFKENISADRLIKAEATDPTTGDAIFRVPYPVSDHRADLKRRERLADAAP